MAMHTEKLHRKLNEWKGQDQSRASEVGEQRADIKEFLELTGWNKTALAFVRKLDKLDEDKRNDILRSLHDLLEEMRPVWDENGTGDMFGHNSNGADEEPEPEKPADPVDYDDGDEEPADDYHDDAPATDEEMVDFNAAVDDVTDEAGNVHPFGVGKRA